MKLYYWTHCGFTSVGFSSNVDVVDVWREVVGVGRVLEYRVRQATEHIHVRT